MLWSISKKALTDKKRGYWMQGYLVYRPSCLQDRQTQTADTRPVALRLPTCKRSASWNNEWRSNINKQF